MRVRGLLSTFAALFASCGGQVSLPEDAEGTAETIIIKLSENQPQVLWEALPKSYQVDANQLARKAIASLDSEIYDKVLSILNKTNKILREKKVFLLSSSQMGLLAKDLEEASANWNALTELLTIILNSQLGSFEKAQKVDIGKLLEDTGSILMGKIATISAMTKEDIWQKEFVRKLKAVRIEKVSGSSKETLLQVTGPDGISEQQNWTKVEGKWIPREVEIGWGENIAKARETIAKNDTDGVDGKFGVMLMLGMIEGILDRLDKSSTQEEFETTLRNLAEFGNFGE